MRTFTGFRKNDIMENQTAIKQAVSLAFKRKQK